MGVVLYSEFCVQDKSVDPFILYGDLYKSIRGSMNDAIYGNQMEELYEITKVYTHTCEATPRLSLFLYTTGPAAL